MGNDRGWCVLGAPDTQRTRENTYIAFHHSWTQVIGTREWCAKSVSSGLLNVRCLARPWFLNPWFGSSSHKWLRRWSLCIACSRTWHFKWPRCLRRKFINILLGTSFSAPNHIYSFAHITHNHSKRTIALLKYRQTRASTLVSDNACQIFGGRALTQSGMGSVIEKYQKSFKFQAILGGSEEIMADFAIRQADKRAKRAGISRL